jgi:N-acetylneuraminate synthase
MDVCAYKIGSGECNNYPLIEHIASYKKPMIISTGMNNLESVGKTVQIVRKHNIPYALLHTTNIYPTPTWLVRLGAMQQMQQTFPDAVIGLSDHTTSNLACFAAAALGASILERHFTDRMDRPGPDIANSMDPIRLNELIIGSQDIARMRGGDKKAAEEEQTTIDFAFASVVTIRQVRRIIY